MVVLGGLGSIWGVVVGAVVLSAINNYLLPRVLYDLPGEVGLDFDLSEITSGIYGLLLVLLMLLRPQGILPERALAAASGRVAAMRRDHWQRRTEALDPEADFAEIYRIIATHEFPWGSSTASPARAGAARSAG